MIVSFCEATYLLLHDVDLRCYIHCLGLSLNHVTLPQQGQQHHYYSLLKTHPTTEPSLYPSDILIMSDSLLVRMLHQIMQ